MKLYLFLLSSVLLAAPLATEVRNKGWILFSAQTEKGDWDLFVMRPDGSQRRNITNTRDANEIGGRYSPDGKRILFRRIPQGVVVKHDRWGTAQLTFANPDSSAPPHMAATASTVGRLGSGRETDGDTDQDRHRNLGHRGQEDRVLHSTAKVSISNSLVAGRPVLHRPRQPLRGELDRDPPQRITGEANAVNKFQNCTADWFPDSKRVIFSSRPANQEDADPKLREAANQKPTYGWTQLFMANGDGTGLKLLYGEDGRHIYGGATSPDGLYVIFTRSPIDGITKSPMGLMRLTDAPIIGGESKALRKVHPKAHEGPVLPLPEGFEPHWTYAK
jgi:hypothetical protein